MHGLNQGAVIDRSIDLVEAVHRAVPDKGPRLRPGIDAYLSFLSERPAAWRLLIRDRPAEAPLAEVHRRLEEERATVLGDLLAPGKSPSNLEVSLVTTAIRTFATWWYEHREVPREQVTDAIVAFARAGATNLSGT